MLMGWNQTESDEEKLRHVIGMNQMRVMKKNLPMLMKLNVYIAMWKR